jgi:phage-related protein
MSAPAAADSSILGSIFSTISLAIGVIFQNIDHTLSIIALVLSIIASTLTIRKLRKKS